VVSDESGCGARWRRTEEAERLAEERHGERLVRANAAGRDDAALALRARLAEVELELPDLAAAEEARQIGDAGEASERVKSSSRLIQSVATARARGARFDSRKGSAERDAGEGAGERG